MTLEKQVCNLELAKRLKELGVKQESVHFWAQDPRDGHFELAKEVYEDIVPSAYFAPIAAFTVAELGEMLPWAVELKSGTAWLETTKNGPKCEVAKTYAVCYATAEADDENNVTDVISEDKEADARANMLIYLLENKLITLP